MKSIVVISYANIREIVGKKEIVLTITDNDTIGDIKTMMTKQYPRLKAVLHNVLFIIDGKIALDGHRPIEGDKITILPRIGGG